jgi:hypothetical protein
VRIQRKSAVSCNFRTFDGRLIWGTIGTWTGVWIGSLWLRLLYGIALSDSVEVENQIIRILFMMGHIVSLMAHLTIHGSNTVKEFPIDIAFPETFLHRETNETGAISGWNVRPDIMIVWAGHPTFDSSRNFTESIARNAIHSGVRGDFGEYSAANGRVISTQKKNL